MLMQPFSCPMGSLSVFLRMPLPYLLVMRASPLRTISVLLTDFELSFHVSFPFSSFLSRDASSMRTTRVQSAQDAQRAREKAEGKSSSGGRGAGAEDEEETGGE